MHDYADAEIREFVSTMDYELGAQRYKPKELMVDFCKSIIIIKQLLKKKKEKENGH